MATLQNQQLPASPQAPWAGTNLGRIILASSLIIIIIIVAVFTYWLLVLKPQVESQPPITNTPIQASSSAKTATPSATSSATPSAKQATQSATASAKK